MTPFESAHLRIGYTASMIKEACEGRGVPSGVSRQDWIAYNQACLVEELARMLVEMNKRNQ